MSRTIKTKELENTSLASNYGGWIYCLGCSQTIGFLCYATYDAFSLRYTCKCGSSGSIRLSLADGTDGQASPEQLLPIKNRLCCPGDESPLVTIRDVNLQSYHCEISCHRCEKRYVKELL